MVKNCYWIKLRSAHSTSSKANIPMPGCGERKYRVCLQGTQQGSGGQASDQFHLVFAGGRGVIKQNNEEAGVNHHLGTFSVTFFNLSLSWRVVNLQCVSFRYKDDSVIQICVYVCVCLYIYIYSFIYIYLYLSIYIYIYILFQILFHYRLLQDIENSSLYFPWHSGSESLDVSLRVRTTSGQVVQDSGVC